MAGQIVMALDLHDKLFDAHVHVWTDDTDAYPLAPGFDKSDLWRPRFTPDDHAQYSSHYGKVRLNLVQMTWYGLEHQYILDLTASDPARFTGTGIVSAWSDVSLPSPDRAMVALARRGIRAFRVRGGGGRAGWLDHNGYEKMFVAGAEHNLALSFLMGLSDLPDLDRMCARHPDTPVILDHLCGVGRNEVVEEAEFDALCRMARHPRVLVKFGPFQGMGRRQRPYRDLLAILRRVVDAFGPQRCMWESDSGGPIWMPEPAKDFPAAVTLIAEHADFLSDSDREWLLYKSAEGGGFDF